MANRSNPEVSMRLKFQLRNLQKGHKVIVSCDDITYTNARVIMHRINVEFKAQLKMKADKEANTYVFHNLGSVPDGGSHLLPADRGHNSIP